MELPYYILVDSSEVSSWLNVRGNNCDTDDTEYYVAVLRELDGDTYNLLYYRSKPHHDGCVMVGCDADGTVSAKNIK